MPVPMMDVGKVRVLMRESLMPVLMAVGLASRNVRPVRMLMVFIMPMPVLVLDFLMNVLMLMALRQMQPEA